MFYKQNDERNDEIDFGVFNVVRNNISFKFWFIKYYGIKINLPLEKIYVLNLNFLSDCKKIQTVKNVYTFKNTSILH